MQNKYEQMFNNYMNLVGFALIKHRDNNSNGCWSVDDATGPALGDIDMDRFHNATEIFDRMDIYIYDYLEGDIIIALDNFGYTEHNNLQRAELVAFCKNSNKLPDYKMEIDILDMICNHANEIDLNNCDFIEED